ncbi:hypothetical protein PspLS_09848 [Pyricularia sp. CBS 133598]|nr:hypothetical protein PspLS_09848 [Pyricularia sp. CBS 133598]
MGQARPPICLESGRQPEPDSLDTPRSASMKHIIAQPVLPIPSRLSADPTVGPRFSAVTLMEMWVK